MLGKKEKGSTPTVVVIERAFTGGKKKVVAYRGCRVRRSRGQKDDAPPPLPPTLREVERGHNQSALG